MDVFQFLRSLGTVPAIWIQIKTPDPLSMRWWLTVNKTLTPAKGKPAWTGSIWVITVPSPFKVSTTLTIRWIWTRTLILWFMSLMVHCLLSILSIFLATASDNICRGLNAEGTSSSTTASKAASKSGLVVRRRSYASLHTLSLGSRPWAGFDCPA